MTHFCRPSKRRKLEEGAHHQTAVLTLQTGHRQKDQQLVESFVVAIDCWDFLQSNITYRGGKSHCVCMCVGVCVGGWVSVCVCVCVEGSVKGTLSLYG